MRRVWGAKRKVRWVDWLIVGLGLVLLARTAENVMRMMKTGGRLDEANNQLQEAREDNLRLKGELAWVNSAEFVEKEARDKLGLGKPGEVQLILPKEGETPETSVGEVGEQNQEKPRWKKWWELYIRI